MCPQMGLKSWKKTPFLLKHLKHEIQLLENDLMLNKFMKASIDGTQIPLLFEYEYSEY